MSKGVVYCVLVAVLFAVAVVAVERPKIVLTDELRRQLDGLERWATLSKKVSSKRDVQDASFECGICSIALNEVEGFVAENLTVTEMQQLLQKDICSKLSGEGLLVCEMVVPLIPTIIESFENKWAVSTVCVDIGMCARPFSNHQDPVPAPSYVINLDLPANQRWKQVCSIPAYQGYMQEFVNGLSSLLEDGGKYIEDVGTLLNTYYYPSELAAEISGCASYLGVSTGWLSIINLGYEISDACTSIVAQAPDGTILHARNLDFWTGIWLTDTLRNSTFQAEFQKGGKTIFHATTFPGFVGILSGQKPGAFSLTIDTRFYPQGFSDMFYEIIAAIQERNASLVTFLSRKVITNENNFASALENLSKDELIADVYYIVAGVSAGEGAVISRNRINATDVWLLNSPSRWYEVQTNYDHWKQPPWFDDRVTPANQGMEKLGQAAVSLEGMMGVLNIKPVFNIQTTYTILSCPATGTYKSFARWCPYPCSE
jgi:hypothetical protein